MRLCTALVSSYLMGYRIRDRSSKTWLTSELVGRLLIAMKALEASMKFAVISNGVVMVVVATSGRG